MERMAIEDSWEWRGWRGRLEMDAVGWGRMRMEGRMRMDKDG